MQGPRMLSYNPAENAVLITSDVDGGSYELYVVPKDASGRSDTPVRSAALSVPPQCKVPWLMCVRPGEAVPRLALPASRYKPSCTQPLLPNLNVGLTVACCHMLTELTC